MPGRKRDKRQLCLAFIPEMEREAEEKAKQERIEFQERVKDGWLHSAVEHYPPTAADWDVILMGIRLSRHVHHNECERCKLGPYNHMPRMLWPAKVCLKDWFRWCGRHGFKDWVRMNQEHQDLF